MSKRSWSAFDVIAAAVTLAVCSLCSRGLRRKDRDTE